MAKSYDPIAPVAEEISEEACLLCFDEFQVQLFNDFTCGCMFFCIRDIESEYIFINVSLNQTFAVIMLFSPADLFVKHISGH